MILQNSSCYTPENEECPLNRVHHFKGKIHLNQRLIFKSYDTLLGTNIAPPKTLLKMIFLFPRWDIRFVEGCFFGGVSFFGGSTQTHPSPNPPSPFLRNLACLTGRRSCPPGKNRVCVFGSRHELLSQSALEKRNESDIFSSITW